MPVIWVGELLPWVDKINDQWNDEEKDCHINNFLNFWLYLFSLSCLREISLVSMLEL